VRGGIPDAVPTPNSLQVNPLARPERWKEGPWRGEDDGERGSAFVRKRHPPTDACNTGAREKARPRERWSRRGAKPPRAEQGRFYTLSGVVLAPISPESLSRELALLLEVDALVPFTLRSGTRCYDMTASSTSVSVLTLI
jgi:hypothetical protein